MQTGAAVSGLLNLSHNPGLHMGTSLMCMLWSAALAAIIGWIAAD